jgi:hypothetical protein
LVVSGAKATLKGTGTIDRVPGYSFLISGIDGGQTGGAYYIRVQIKDPGGNVFYDTQLGAPETADPTTTLNNGGKIQIH